MAFIAPRGRAADVENWDELLVEVGKDRREINEATSKSRKIVGACSCVNAGQRRARFRLRLDG